MSKIWLLVRITLLFALAAVIICSLIWLVQGVPHPDPAAPPHTPDDLFLYYATDPWELAASELVSSVQLQTSSRIGL